MTLEDSNLTLKGGVAITAESTSETPSFDGNIAIFFDYLTEESNTAEASITDNWVESNYTLQDHIAVKPRIYRLRGYVGEVVFKQPNNLLTTSLQWSGAKAIAYGKQPIWEKTYQAVQAVNAISGIVSNYTQAAMNVVKQLESSYNRYKQIYEAYKDINQEFVGKRQKTVSTILLNLLETRTPVQLTDLALSDVTEIQELKGDRLYFLQSVSTKQGDNAFISDIEVTIKEFRIATSRITKVDTSKFAGDVATQKTEEAKNGEANTKEVAKEVVNNIMDKAKNAVEKAAEFQRKFPGSETFTTMMGIPNLNLVNTAWDLLKYGAKVIQTIGQVK